MPARLLRDSASVLDASFEVGLSGPGRLHDLFVTHEAMSPGEWKSGGDGLTISLRLPPVAVRHRAGDGDRARARRSRLRRCRRGAGGARRHARPLAARRTMSRTARAPRRWRSASSTRKLWRPDRPLRVVLIGTDFEVRVWETLLRIPMGRATTYSDIAAQDRARRRPSRAVGAAVGKNPVSFVVPCHRVLGKSGDHHRLSLGPDPQARDAGLGGRAGRGVVARAKKKRARPDGGARFACRVGVCYRPASSREMLRTATRRFSRLGPSIGILRNCSP